MKRKLLPVIVLGLVLLSAAAALADGDIYVGGPWGTKITSLPYEIKTPGAYYLGGNLSKTGGGDGITITAGVNHVTLDLMGFTLNGSGSGHYGIYLNGSKNVENRNGTVTGWGTGIIENSNSGILHRIINVRAVGNSTGIHLYGGCHLVKGCEATATDVQYAIRIAFVSRVSGCKVKFVDGYGIKVSGGIVSDNVVLSTGTGSNRYGISAGNETLIKGNKVSGCTTGIFVIAQGLNVIGNAVDAAAGTTGINLYDVSSNLEDQNTVTGAGTRYNADYVNVKRRSYYAPIP